MCFAYWRRARGFVGLLLVPLVINRQGYEKPHFILPQPPNGISLSCSLLIIACIPVRTSYLIQKLKTSRNWSGWKVLFELSSDDIIEFYLANKYQNILLVINLSYKDIKRTKTSISAPRHLLHGLYYPEGCLGSGISSTSFTWT